MVIFLELDDVLRMHAYQTSHFGGDSTVLDQGRLESALAQPRQSFGGQYLHEDLASMAAAYLFHIVQNHPFADGNKRTGTQAALVFLDINGRPLELDTDEMEQVVVRVASGQMDKVGLTTFIRQCLVDQYGAL